MTAAAKLGGVSRQTIYKRINKGIVRTTERYGVPLVYRADIVKIKHKNSKP